jgi:hypothetical protein
MKHRKTAAPKNNYFHFPFSFQKLKTIIIEHVRAKGNLYKIFSEKYAGSNPTASKNYF